jgi:hypothetical protein
MKAILCILLGWVCVTSAGVISLVQDVNMPDPNEEVTVWVHSEDPLFCMGLAVYVVGDATITTAMSEADCNEFGWDNGWNSDPVIDPNGWVYLGSVRWASDVNDIVGYFKFRYHSGQVSVSIDQENSLAFSWDGESIPYSTFSTETLLFGQADLMQGGGSLATDLTDESGQLSEDANTLTPPPLVPADPNKPHPILLYCPAIESNLSLNFGAKSESYPLERSENSEEMLLDGLDSEPNVIEISSDITTNQIWTAENIYHVTANVNIQALLVIEPNTTIAFGYYGALIVNNGGTLLSAGTPDKPIIYTAYEPYGWSDYECAIHIEETASPATKIAYCHIECAYTAIQIDNIKLDAPIENNRLLYNNVGILEYGTHHTDIVNNLIALGFNQYYYSTGIHVNMESAEGIGDANSTILIQNNTCDYQDYGIVILGTDDANNSGEVTLVNNIVAESAEYGFVLADGYMYAIVLNTGYYGNTADKNWEFDEYDPVTATAFPFDQTEWRLNATCPFIDAGLEYIEQTRLIGTTTDVNSLPDSNVVDIGFHYPNWSYANAGTGLAETDYNEDGFTDEADLIPFCNAWLTNDPNIDLNGNNIVNLADFTLFASNWYHLQGNPSLLVSIIEDSNSLGLLTIDSNDSSFFTNPRFVLMDGQFMGGTTELNDYPVVVEGYRYLNGTHEFKVVTAMPDGAITVSPSQAVIFDNPLYCTDFNDFFHPTVDYEIKGFHDGNTVVEVNLVDINNNSLWSDSGSGQDVNIVVPQAIFANQRYCSLKITETESGQMMMGFGENAMDSSSSGSQKINLTKKYKPEDYAGQTIQMLIITPNTDVFGYKEPVIMQCAKACNARNVNWVPLHDKDVTSANLTNLLRPDTLRWVYWVGHANSYVGRTPEQETRDEGGVQRTCMACWQIGDHWWSNDTELLALSWTRQTATSSPILPNNWDNRGFDLWTIGMHNSTGKRIVFVDGCQSARYPDMAYTFGLFNSGNNDQIYIGWRPNVILNRGKNNLFAPRNFEKFTARTNPGIIRFWEQMGLGKTVYQAMESTTSTGYLPGETVIALWGENMQMNLGNESGDDNFFVRGTGTGNKLGYGN